MAEYSSRREGRASGLVPLKIQYADYAIWQRSYLSGEVLDKKLNYWKERLQGTEVLQLPTDYARPAVQGIRGAAYHFWIDKPTSDGLNELTRNQGATLFMTLLSAFQVLLSRYSGQEDISVGTPVANRGQAEVEGLIGFFVNTLVLRTRVEEGLGLYVIVVRVFN